MLACGLDLALGELVPITNAAAHELLEEDKFADRQTSRYNFAFAGEYGRVYKVGRSTPTPARWIRLQIERKGTGAELSDVPAHGADRARYDARAGRLDARAAAR